MSREYVGHSSHWGAFEAMDTDAGLLVRGHPGDPDPARLLGNIPGALRHEARVKRPAVRRGWLEHGPGPDPMRGKDTFVEVTWDEAEGLIAAELSRVYRESGADAVFGGSYGWGSAGRFHHPQSQVHRFLNSLGGYVGSRNDYSTAAASVILSHVLGEGLDPVHGMASWSEIAEHTELMVCFGGVPLRNASVAPGGISRHHTRGWVEKLARGGATVVLFSPDREDLAEPLVGQWHALRPGTDVAVLLALLQVLVSGDLYDHRFVERYCSGFEELRDYVMGGSDGLPKTPEWAASIAEVDPGELRGLAREMTRRRTLVTMTWSLQRSEHGEQPPWAALALAAAIGQIGLPGGGFGLGFGSMGDVGAPVLASPRLPTLPQGANPVTEFIPAARIADMLLHPGEQFDYDGRTLSYPDIALVYWCGGNPFHHHQDLTRLRRAFQRPETVVVHDPFWTATARHADVVLPSTVTLEREDIGASRRDPQLLAMHHVAEAHASARDDYSTFCALADRLGTGWFSQGRTAAQWLRVMYDDWRREVAAPGMEPPDFDTFWSAGQVELPTRPPNEKLRRFLDDPHGSPLSTPSGLIELSSPEVGSFGYADCPGHPSWLEPREWLGADRAREFPLSLLASQPGNRLHSQHDMGAVSMAAKVAGREPLTMHPDDARLRGIDEGDVVMVFNDRGRCLAGVRLRGTLRPGVVRLSTGAWLDPMPDVEPMMCVHGNPNVLTADSGTSSLAQGCAGAYTLVEVERFVGTPPPVRAHQQPSLETRTPTTRRPETNNG